MTSGEVLQLTRHLLQQLSRCHSISKVVAIVAHSAIEALVAASGSRFERICSRLDFDPDRSFIDSVLGYPSWAAHLPSGADTLFLNFRNPLTSADRIDRAIAEFRDSAADILISVVQPVDHPCQMYYADRQSGGLEIHLSGVDQRFFKRPYPPVSHLWCFTDDGRRLLNVKEGREIQGRQEYPHIFEADDSFVICAAHALSPTAMPLDQLCIAGHLLPPKASIIIRSRLDLLRLQALLKAEGEGC